MPPQSAYRVRLPILTAKPAIVDQDGGRTVCLLFSDYAAIVRELKAACLALGGTREECQAD